MSVARPFEGSRALVVDDDPAIVHLLRLFLEQLGFSVASAGSGPEALAVLGRQPIDLAITDLAMPGMTGIDLIREARSRGHDNEFLVLTAVGSVPTAVQAMKSGAFEFLEKPVRFDQLRATVEGAMKHRSAAASTARTTAGATGEPATGEVTAPAGSPVGSASSPSPSSPSLPVGDSGQLPFSCIGRYEIAELIGRGGMGEVFRCRDPLLGRVVAVKVMRLGTERPDRTAELLARFQREAAAAGALQHPGIVAVHDLGRDHLLGLWYIVLELVEGRSLDRLLEERRQLPPKEVVSLGFQLADALAFAHARGIVHRDVKPANVLVRKDGTIKLLDFGIAAVSGSDLTLRDQLLGSPAYMAPERIRGRPSGPAADQFSLGVVLYEMLAGTNPFDDETQEGRMVKVLESRPAPLVAAVPQAPRPLLELIGRMMARRPEERFPAMEDVVEELGRIGAAAGLQLERYVVPEAG